MNYCSKTNPIILYPNNPSNNLCHWQHLQIYFTSHLRQQNQKQVQDCIKFTLEMQIEDKILTKRGSKSLNVEDYRVMRILAFTNLLFKNRGRDIEIPIKLCKRSQNRRWAFFDFKYFENPLQKFRKSLHITTSLKRFKSQKSFIYLWYFWHF